MNISRQSLRHAYISLESSACISCQWRSFSSSYRRFASVQAPSKSAAQAAQPAELQPAKAPPEPSVLAEAPRAYGKALDEFTPKALNRPIGLANPPKVGENSGIDHRTRSQRWQDFVNYDKHLAKRKMLTRRMSTPYFREWSNMRHHKGKSFLAPDRLFKGQHALYFPNICGQTLLKTKQRAKFPSSTTSVLTGKISIVSVFSSQWAFKQAQTFVSPGINSELHEVVKNSRSKAQMVQVNIEESALKALIIQMFKGSLRKSVGGEEEWRRYFVVKKGLNEDIRDAIGLLNSKVGYTYLLDENCKIRWAGSGNAEDAERVGLVKGVKFLLDEYKGARGRT